MDEEPGVSTGEVARRLGVSATTVRSWERRYGIGPAIRAAGRHRRYRLEDVARLEYMCRLTARGLAPAEAARLAVAGAVPPDPPTAVDVGRGVNSAVQPAGVDRSAVLGTGGGARDAGRGLASAAARMDAVAMEEVLGASLSRYGVVPTWEELAAPVLRSVGKQWAGSGGGFVEVEHLLSATISRCLHRAASAVRPLPGAAPGRVLLAGAPSDLHTLPLDALHSALLQARVPVLMLGAAVPAAALRSAARRCEAVAVVVWSQHRPTADPGQLAELAELRWGVAGARRAVRVHAAGAGWHGLPLPAGVSRLNDLRSAVALLGKPWQRTAAGG